MGTPKTVTINFYSNGYIIIKRKVIKFEIFSILEYHKSSSTPRMHAKHLHTPKLPRHFGMPSPKLDHHRSLQQLTEKLSEIPKKFQIFPATWEKLST